MGAISSSLDLGSHVSLSIYMFSPLRNGAAGSGGNRGYAQTSAWESG
jgi:hypothetical protein